jgi:phosphate transport system permease protein
MIVAASGRTGSNRNVVPSSGLAATIIDYIDGISVKPVEQTLYAMAAVLLVSCAFLSLAGWAAKQPLKRYGIAA